MEEKIIEFKTAQLAKEKGFKSKSRYYGGDGKLVEVPDIPENDYRHTNNAMQRFGYEAPTQSILQTWLRNKKILVEVRPIGDWNHWRYSISMEDCMSPFFEIKNNNEYPSYEDALEAGLYEGLINIK